MTPRESKAVKAMKAPVVAWPLGLIVVGLGLWRIYQHPPGATEWKHMASDGALVALGVLILPGVAQYIALNAKALLAVWLTYRAAKKDPSGKEDSR